MAAFTFTYFYFLQSCFQHIQAPSVFFSTLPPGYHFHSAFAIQSIFLLGHPPTFTSSDTSQDNKPILSICSTSRHSSLLPGLPPCSSYQLHHIALRHHSLIQDWLFTLSCGVFHSRLKTHLFFKSIPAAFRLSHVLISWTTDIRCLGVIGV